MQASSARDRLQEQVDAAGLDIDVGNMTPREVTAAFDRALERRRQRALDADFLAYLIGRYVALAVHAPKKYPQHPDAVRRTMKDNDMKRCFVALSERGKAHGDC